MVFDVASNGNGVPSIHELPGRVKEERERHPFHGIRRYGPRHFANFNDGVVARLAPLNYLDRYRYRRRDASADKELGRRTFHDIADT